MINRIIKSGGITENKHGVNNIHKKKNSDNPSISFQSILDNEKIKYDESLLNKNIK